LIEGGECVVNRTPKLIEKTGHGLTKPHPVDTLEVSVPNDTQANGRCRAR
jgi:hypothetical protein